MNSPGREALARIPPTVPAARNTACGRRSAIHFSTWSWRRRSTSSRPAVTISQPSAPKRRTIADPAMPRWPATQTRFPFNEKGVRPLFCSFMMIKGTIAVLLDQALALGLLKVLLRHFGNQLAERDLGAPAEPGARLG